MHVPHGLQGWQQRAHLHGGPQTLRGGAARELPAGHHDTCAVDDNALQRHVQRTQLRHRSLHTPHLLSQLLRVRPHRVLHSACIYVGRVAIPRSPVR
jgi:hypothetical protein